jgi:glycosyltransferase involved in cell wall biosynthesis
MRLLYVIHQFFPDCHSGTEQYCLAMAREARRNGDDVTVLSMHYEWDRAQPSIDLFEQPYDGFRVLRLNHWWRLNPNTVLRDYENLHLDGWFQRVLDDVRPAAVHFFHLRQLGSNLIAVAKRAGLRVVVSLTDFWFLCPRFTLLRRNGSLCDGPPEGGAGCVACEHPELSGVAADIGPAQLSEQPGARLRALLDRMGHNFAALALADMVAAPSHFLADMFAKNGFPRERISVVPYGLEPGRIVRQPVTRPRTPLRLGFCGVLSPWKAPHVAVDAVLGSDLPVQLTIHGRTREGMFQDYIDALMARAAADPRIRFAGAYDAAAASDIFAAMDVLIVPSVWYENTPFVVLEAQAAGVPVLASDLGGLREALLHGNGCLFRAGDAMHLRAQITSMLGTAAPGPATAPRGSQRDYATFRSAYA